MLLPFFAIFVTLIGLPATVLFFVGRSKRLETELKLKQEERRILELEIRKQEIQIRRLTMENEKYDRLISEDSES